MKKSSNHYPMTWNEVKEKTGLSGVDLAGKLGIHPMTGNKWSSKGRIPIVTMARDGVKLYIGKAIDKLLAEVGFNKPITPVKTKRKSEKGKFIRLEKHIQQTPIGKFKAHNPESKKAKTFDTIEEARLYVLESSKRKPVKKAVKKIVTNMHSEIVSIPMEDDLVLNETSDDFIVVLISNSEDKIVNILKKVMN